MDDLNIRLFFKACETGSITVVEKLIDIGIDVNSVNNNGQTGLIQALRCNSYNVAKLLLEHGVDVNIQDKNEYTALIYASLTGKYEIVEILLKYGANIDINTCFRNNALFIASLHGYTDIVKLLLKHGADSNPTNNDKYTFRSFSGYSNAKKEIEEIIEDIHNRKANIKPAKKFLQVTEN